MISQLDIKVEELLNSKILIVKDASWYNPEVPVTNARIDLQYPGSTDYFSIPVGKNFTYVINSNTLNITNVAHSDNLSELPDGIWTIKYSICPNDELFVEYTFLRNTKQLIKWHNLYCSLQIDRCAKKKYLEELKKLREIKDIIDAAKYLADCGKYEKSIELYDYADTLLSEFSSNCNCF
jgi:hypothetical protein